MDIVDSLKKFHPHPITYALLAAVLFGMSTPLSKLMLTDTRPVMLAALMYLGSGFGAFLLKQILSSPRRSENREAGLKKPDLPWLSGAVIAGGVAGPILLMISLKATPASTASLLLNFESVATALIAGWFFQEHISRKVWFGLGLITLASIHLTFSDGSWGFSFGSLGIIAACLFWGLDNNFTRKVSSKDPLEIVTVKGLAAGTFSLILSLGIGDPIPGLINILLALLVGAICYGLSITMFVLALRSLGAARTGVMFATAPFVGAILSFILFRDPLSFQQYLSLPLMVTGVILLFIENHFHRHVHENIEHEHRHTHDDLHHAHKHPPGMNTSLDQHSHLHRHEKDEHTHAHTPDLHHSHDHPD